MTPIPHAQTFELLRTKLALPRLSPSVIRRERLIARLDDGLMNSKLTLLSAPAGFGKSTLVSEWINTRAADDKPLPVAWVSFDAGDNDPVRFWRYVITAFQNFQADIGETALAQLRAPQEPAFESILTRLINDLTALPYQYLLVLENYEVIVSPPVHDTLAFLIGHLPPNLHVIILTRHDPPLPLARWRAHAELTEIRAGDLRFSPEETRALIQQAVSFDLSPQALTRLVDRTEGWAAGLHLLTLALQSRHTPDQAEAFITTFSGSLRPIQEYLIGDVFSAQSESIQLFLLQTSVLNRLTADLCDAVTGRRDSQMMLEQIERDNLFLIALDGADEWYRYHGLFAEAMQHFARHQLGEDVIHRLHDRASQWYEQAGFLGDAIEAALSAQAFERASALIKNVLEQTGGLPNEIHTLRRWLEHLPEEVRQASPELCFAYALVLLFTQDRRAPATAALLEAPLSLAEQHWRAMHDRPKLGQALAFRTMVAWWQGDYARVFEMSNQAVKLLPADNTIWRGISLIHVGTGELGAGRITSARQAAQEARDLSAAAHQLNGELAAIAILGEITEWQGELHQAAQLHQEVLDRSSSIQGSEPGYDRGWALAGLGRLAYEWNDLESAEQNAAEVLEIGKQLRADDLIVRGVILLARARIARGEYTRAQEQISSAAALVRSPSLRRELDAFGAWITLAAGNAAAAQHRITALAQQHTDYLPLIQQEYEALVQARLHLAQGKPTAALPLLDYWLTDAYAQGRVSRTIQILILKALALAAQANLPDARESLYHALSLVQVGGYRRTFLDEGEPLMALLRDVLPDISAEPAGAMVRGLLAVFVQEQDADSSYSLPGRHNDLLTPQEQRVLRLLSAGMSNPEIAEELIVSVNTIKTHVKHIYRKLNVTDRDQAAEVARHFRLY